MGKLGLGPFGVALTVSDTYLDEAAELERLGYSAIWLPGGQIDSLRRLADVIGPLRRPWSDRRSFPWMSIGRRWSPGSTRNWRRPKSHAPS